MDDASLLEMAQDLAKRLMTETPAKRKAAVEAWYAEILAMEGRERANFAFTLYTIVQASMAEQTDPVLGPNDSAEERKFYRNFFFYCFLALLVLLVIIIWQLPRLREFNSEVATIGAFSVIGVMLGAALFGAMRSSGTFKGKKYGLAFQLGGPAALAGLVIVAGVGYEAWQRKRDFAFSVYIYRDNQRGNVVQANGILTLLLDERKDVTINSGSAYPQRIPAKWSGKRVAYSLQLAGYKEVTPQDGLQIGPDVQIYIHVAAHP